MIENFSSSKRFRYFWYISFGFIILLKFFQHDHKCLISKSVGDGRDQDCHRVYEVINYNKTESFIGLQYGCVFLDKFRGENFGLRVVWMKTICYGD